METIVGKLDLRVGNCASDNYVLGIFNGWGERSRII